MAALERQIKILGAHAVFTYPFACIPFLFFYFDAHGLGLDRYLQLIALYYWAMVAMEVPTGLFADRFGRRHSLIAGSTLLAAGFFTICAGSTFTVFCIGEVLFGVGHSLLSGASTAILYDSLERSDEQGRFLVVESRIHALRLIGTGLSFLVGGIVAWGFGIEPTIVLTGVFCLVGAILAWLVHEPPRLAGPSKPPPLLRAALRDLNDRRLLWLIVYYIILFGLLRFAFHTYQPYFNETVLDPTRPKQNWLILGVLFAALNLFAAPWSRLAPALSERMRFRTLFAAMPACLCLAFLAMAVMPNWIGVALFFVHQVPFALHWALIQDFTNRRITSTNRATALSILSFLGRLSFALWIPIVGIYEHEEGTPATYWVLGWIGLGLTVAWCAPGLGIRLLGRGRQPD